jgi:hypothetical protein
MEQKSNIPAFFNSLEAVAKPRAAVIPFTVNVHGEPSAARNLLFIECERKTDSSSLHSSE